MKQFLPAIIFFFVFSSCTHYQYLTVSSPTLAKNEKNELVAENDTLKVQYHFADYKGQVGISIFNKSGQPLEVDWKKSAIIIDGKAFSYFNPNAALSATVERDSLRWQARFGSVGDPLYIASLNGSIFIDEPVQFIPPASFIYKVPLALPIEPFQNLPEQLAKRETAKWNENLFVSYTKLAFEKSSSPLQFRSYLTLRIGGSGQQKEFTAEHSFYISEVWKTTAGPDNFPAGVLNRGDRFYLQP